jgi:hypothetical protein
MRRNFTGLVARGIEPATVVGDTFKAVCDDYLEREKEKLRTVEWRRTTFARLVYPTFGAKPISDIKRSDVVRLLDKIEDENGGPMPGVCPPGLQLACPRSDDFRSPIVRGMARTKPSTRARDRVLTDAELKAVWNASGNAGVFG